MIRRLFIQSLFFWLLGGGMVAEAGIPFRVGEPFPDFALPSMDSREPVSIRDFRGEKLILHIWASW